MKVLVCGGRTWGLVPHCGPLSIISERTSQREITQEILWQIAEDEGIDMIIEGGALGADRSARSWADSNLVPCMTVEANWAEYGRAAGPMRNDDMLKMSPDLVVAFPGGAGTKDLVTKARKAGVTVREYDNQGKEV